MLDTWIHNIESHELYLRGLYKASMCVSSDACDEIALVLIPGKAFHETIF